MKKVNRLVLTRDKATNQKNTPFLVGQLLLGVGPQNKYSLTMYFSSHIPGDGQQCECKGSANQESNETNSFISKAELLPAFVILMAKIYKIIESPNMIFNFLYINVSFARNI